jgi:hypothetical protein
LLQTFRWQNQEPFSPSNGPELLDHIVELTQSIPNFPRVLNRDLRPVLQHVRVSAPNADASNVFISGIPDALDSYRQVTIPAYLVFFAHIGGFQYPLAVQKRLLLLFSHKTEHSKVISEIG